MVSLYKLLVSEKGINAEKPFVDASTTEIAMTLSPLPPEYWTTFTEKPDVPFSLGRTEYTLNSLKQQPTSIWMFLHQIKQFLQQTK